MGNVQDDDLLSLVINLVDDTVIAYADTPTVGVASKFGHIVRSGLILQGQESLVDARAYFGAKSKGSGQAWEPPPLGKLTLYLSYG